MTSWGHIGNRKVKMRVNQIFLRWLWTFPRNPTTFSLCTCTKYSTGSHFAFTCIIKIQTSTLVFYFFNRSCCTGIFTLLRQWTRREFPREGWQMLKHLKIFLKYFLIMIAFFAITQLNNLTRSRLTIYYCTRKSRSLAI